MKERDSATYQCRLLIHTKPWTIQIEPTAFHRPKKGPSIADVLKEMGLDVEVYEANRKLDEEITQLRTEVQSDIEHTAEWHLKWEQAEALIEAAMALLDPQKPHPVYIWRERVEKAAKVLRGEK